jgi:hypothetical protein
VSRQNKRPRQTSSTQAGITGGLCALQTIEAQSYSPMEEEQKHNPAQLLEDSTHTGLRAGINTTE